MVADYHLVVTLVKHTIRRFRHTAAVPVYGNDLTVYIYRLVFKHGHMSLHTYRAPASAKLTRTYAEHSC